MAVITRPSPRPASSARSARPARRGRLLAGPAAALAAALTVGACAVTPDPAAAPAASAGAGARAAAPPLTTAQAAQVFDAYVAATARAQETGDDQLALSVTTGVQQATQSAALQYARYLAGIASSGSPGGSDSPGGSGSLGGSGGPGAYRSSLTVTPAVTTYGTPAFYIPGQSGYPRFFVADVVAATPTRTVTFTTAALSHVAIPASGRALMLFEQAKADAPWLLAATDQLPAGLTVPKLSLDGAGYARTVPLSITTLLARPDLAGALQAAVADDGPASPAATAVAAGPLTTGLYQAARGHATGLTAPPGDAYQWALAGTKQPRFALRTADGGALVFYAMTFTTTIATPGYLAKDYPLTTGPVIDYPSTLAPWLAKTTPRPRVSLQAQALLSFAAVDPPPGTAKIEVIAMGGGLAYASAS